MPALTAFRGHLIAFNRVIAFWDCWLLGEQSFHGLLQFFFFSLKLRPDYKACGGKSYDSKIGLRVNVLKILGTMLKHDINTEYDSWLLEQAQLLRDRDFQHLDIDNLVEELEALVRGEKSSVEQFALLNYASSAVN